MQYDKLKSSTSFAQLRKRGGSFVAPAFVILAQKVNDDSTVKIGFTTSKKIGNAVTRVKARRRLKAALNKISPETINQLNGLELNIIARYKSLDLDLDKLEFYFSKTLNNIIHNLKKDEKKD